MKKILRSALTLSSIAILTFMGCDSDDSPAKTNTGVGTIQYQIIGEDITYEKLGPYDSDFGVTFADIKYAYMIVKDPIINHAHDEKAVALRHAGEDLSGIWAVDLMKKVDGKWAPTILGKKDGVAAGMYEGKPSITIHLPADENEWKKVEGDQAVKAKLNAKNLSFMFGGTITKDGVNYTYEIQENLIAKIGIKEFPTIENKKTGTKGTLLKVEDGKTLIAQFHPHIDHALEVLGDIKNIDFTKLETADDGKTLIFSESKNKDLYKDMVTHITRGSHWDVNVIPE